MLFKVEDLITKKVEVIHAQRLKFYEDSSLHVTEDLINQIAHDGNGFLINRLNDLRLNAVSGIPEIQVIWQGFEESDSTWEPVENLRNGFEESDSTWEPVENLRNDVPVLVKAFLKNRMADPLASGLFSSLF